MIKRRYPTELYVLALEYSLIDRYNWQQKRELIAKGNLMNLSTFLFKNTYDKKTSRSKYCEFSDSKNLSSYLGI